MAAMALFSSTIATYARGNMPSDPVRSLRPLAQSAFMNSVIEILSLGRMARSPASEG